MLPTAATAIAAALPRIYSTVVQHGEAFTNVFAVRPRAIVVDSADGGELRIRWTHWSPTSASGYGRAYPDHGSFAITVRAADVIEGRVHPPNGGRETRRQELSAESTRARDGRDDLDMGEGELGWQPGKRPVPLAGLTSASVPMPAAHA
jgi:hypothetical protein